MTHRPDDPGMQLARDQPRGVGARAAGRADDEPGELGDPDHQQRPQHGTTLTDPRTVGALRMGSTLQVRSYEKPPRRDASLLGDFHRIEAGENRAASGGRILVDLTRLG